MANTNIILWVNNDLARVLPIVKSFEPVYIWDNENRRFTDKQETKDGLPIWEGQALMPVGWGANLTPIRVRMASHSKPTHQPNSQALMNLLNGNSASSSKSSSLPSLSK